MLFPISATPYRIHTTDSYCKESGTPMPMRRSFTFDYAKVVQDKNLKHNGTLQQAFNSPFRPFVLATTSVGQEGLDFHWYTRKIVHWNLPSNPVDMEQREGRINRYKCLAIRRNIAKFFGNEISYSATLPIPKISDGSVKKSSTSWNVSKRGDWKSWIWMQT